MQKYISKVINQNQEVIFGVTVRNTVGDYRKLVRETTIRANIALTRTNPSLRAAKPHAFPPGFWTCLFTHPTLLTFLPPHIRINRHDRFNLQDRYLCAILLLIKLRIQLPIRATFILSIALIMSICNGESF